MKKIRIERGVKYEEDKDLKGGGNQENNVHDFISLQPTHTCSN